MRPRVSRKRGDDDDMKAEPQFRFDVHETPRRTLLLDHEGRRIERGIGYRREWHTRTDSEDE